MVPRVVWVEGNRELAEDVVAVDVEVGAVDAGVEFVVAEVVVVVAEVVVVVVEVVVVDVEVVVVDGVVERVVVEDGAVVDGEFEVMEVGMMVRLEELVECKLVADKTATLVGNLDCMMDVVAGMWVVQVVGMMV